MLPMDQNAVTDRDGSSVESVRSRASEGMSPQGLNRRGKTSARGSVSKPVESSACAPRLESTASPKKGDDVNKDTDPTAVEEEEDDIEDEVEMPEDLVNLPPSVQQKKIKIRAAILMTIGTVLTLVRGLVYF